MNHYIISDIPTPWREPVFERVHARLGGALEVVYFSDNERRRLWTFEQGRHPKTILRGLRLTPKTTERYFNPGIVPYLLQRQPRAALICASLKDPTAWLAMFICRALRTRVALIADTWLGRDREVSPLQRRARHLAYNRCGDAYVGASRQTLAMFRQYNPAIRDEQCFLSHLVADNDHFARQLADRRPERRFDVMFAGRIVDGKNPVFFANVCAGIRARRGRCSVLIIGEGDDALKSQMRDVFGRQGVSYEFAGFIPHASLPDYYAQARLLLMPTSADCWGVVINEAMLAGTPVITTEWTAAAGELVLHEQNGLVLPLDADTWAAAASAILDDGARWAVISEAARAKVQEFNYDRAASGILDAFAYLKSGRRASGAMGTP